MNDIMDDFCYFTNLLTRIVGVVRSRGARLVQFSVPRADKTDGMPTYNEVKAHLAKHGIKTYSGLHDSKKLYFSVSAKQAKFTRYLYDEQTGQMRSTRSTWTERRTGKTRKMSFWEGWF